MQSLHRASETESNPDLFSMQSTPVLAATEANTAQQTETEDLWAEWPYCWAIDLYETVRYSFHSFHEKHTDWKLARYNRRAQAEFQHEFWNSWQREDEDEGEWTHEADTSFRAFDPVRSF